MCDVFYLADYIFSASMDRTVCVWRRDEGREQLQYPWFSRWQSITIGNSVEVWPMSLTAVMLRSLQKARLYVGNSVGELLMFEKEDDFVDGASPAALAHPPAPTLTALWSGAQVRRRSRCSSGSTTVRRT